MRVRSEGLRVCLLEIFPSGGLQDVMQLLEDCWSDSRMGLSAYSHNIDLSERKADLPFYKKIGRSANQPLHI